MSALRLDDNKKDNFIVQAGILAAAGIISRIIGLLYKSPLDSIIGERGLGFYQATYEYYAIILLISSYSIPSAMSKVIAQKLALKEYRNAHRLFRTALVYTAVVGLAAGLFLFFAAGIFVDAEVIPVLRTFAPTIFFYGFLGVIRGYFQAHKSMLQTSVSQIVEQVINAGVSIGAAIVLIQISMGTMAEPADLAGQVRRAKFGAMGSAMGTGAGVLAGLVFMLVVYGMNRKLFKRRIEEDTHEEVDSVKSMLKTITFIVAPFILSTAIYDMSKPLNNAIYTKIIPALKDTVVIGEGDVYTKWGIFSGIAMTVSNIPIAFASAMASAMIPSVSQLAAAKQFEEAKKKIGQAVKTTMIISIPCAVGLFALAKPAVYLLFPRSDEVITTAGRALMTLAFSVVLYALSTLGSSILQGLGRVNVPIINSATALFFQTAASFLLLYFTNLDFYALSIANTLYAGTVCILNQRAVKKTVGYEQEIRKTFVVPTVASVLMGIVARSVYEGLLLVTSSVRVSVVIAIVAAIPVYFVLLFVLKGLNEEEIKSFPGGYRLYALARKLRLMR